MRLMFALLLALLPLAGLAQQAAQPEGTITVEDSAQQDAAIAVRIRDILGELDGYGDVTVTVSSGIVTLRGTTLDAAAAARLNEITRRVQGVVAIRNEVHETTDVVERLNPAVQRFRNRLVQFVTILPLLSIAIVVFALITATGFLLAGLKRPWDRIAPNLFIADIYRQAVRLVFAIAGVVVALDLLGATALLSTILGAAGIVGLAIGFAVRDTVENFIASVLLSVRQPFRPNDTVEIDGDQGKVIRLTSRATILLSYDGNHIRIPNATVFKSRIVNFTRNDERRFLVDFGIGYDADLARAQAIVLETVAALPFTLANPAPSVWIETLDTHTVTVRVAGWIAQHETSFQLARSEAARLCLLALKAGGVPMPEPTYRIVSEGARGPGGTPGKAGPPPEMEAQEVSATAEKELSRIVEAERRDQKDGDLLSRAAPEE
ncbi:mechanosensitive ion channel family protein [Seohaeicola zhoushanensis]|uniref:Small-conductance mechanosensitive channel n=1 Tax=Seohaeicola zhoushanensis TaxID=1569283 RepID=A0A8J3H120_9RHOB|nr:mechanosensitive ion channel family protein [Seohaeicola zhoushanensis]GHF69177.1 mechanosensitive ion channel protein MscS [Seohaeicola zhoushanensis]